MVSSCFEMAPEISQIKEQLMDVHKRLVKLIPSLDKENIDILNELKVISKKTSEAGKMASAYHLLHLLLPYTNKCDEIFSAVRSLSSKRTGALIVVQREVRIDDWITKGTPLYGEITSSLLNSIFHVASPLHDGAVWIHNDMILSAANILPLTKKTYKNTKLGTRHRAAIGLSERTDALVFVVSEETGQESFAINGSLYPFKVMS
ncbi:hypothetical protein J31TS4_03190 [Paenibacillus sp. J31TS4]|uniref:sporulation-specific diadenylate cyclase CdaS n=1 Tax=Paenibacillus sp. J31TS4 TaxID=2807195 RepID=UPI001B2AA9F6|nr:sporulation-specific diadenylate cyclase CdaS [Paenibacillus sp. J31TS4]GIP37039.1 hypothetical protein J31TS4_03190 [Paenibacillus sp. J31TS4]